LIEFKVANGFECVEVSRYFVPLTLLGRLAVKTGAHRGLVHSMPKWSLEFAVKVRKSWNGLRFRTAQLAEGTRAGEKCAHR